MNEEKLYTIQELWDQGGGKPIDVQYRDWEFNKFFHVIGMTPKGEALGWVQDETYYVAINASYWRLYIPPKKKVMLYPALLRTVLGGYCISDTLYISEHDAVHAWINNPTLFVKLLTDRGIEIEEDDKKD